MVTNFKSKLNDLIEYYGSGFGPAINNLLLYGPFEKQIIHPDNLKIITAREKVIVYAYENNILPKLNLIVNTLTPKEIKFSKTRRLVDILEIKPFEEIREIIARNYNGQFKLDYSTLSSIYSKKKLPENNYINFKEINGFLISTRKKNSKMLEKKYNNLYFSLINNSNSKLNKFDFENFILRVIDSSYKYWDEYSYFQKVYDKLNNFLIGDDLGVKIIDLNQKRAEKRMKELVKIEGNLNIPGFKTVKDRFDDHRFRLKFKRPGGIHYTLTDLGLNNFPLEIQYQGIKTIIFDNYGPNSHKLYTLRNKKLQFND